MQITKTYVPGGSTVTHQFIGRYFSLIECGADVRVSFFRNGQLWEESDGVGIGYWSEQESGQFFDRIDIFSTVSQFVRFGVTRGRGGINYQQGASASVVSSGGISPEYVGNIRQYLGLMEPSLDASSLDAAMMFMQAWPSTSFSQTLYLLSNSIRSSSENLHGVVSMLGEFLTVPVKFNDSGMSDDFMSAYYKYAEPFNPSLTLDYPVMLIGSATDLRALINNKLFFGA